MHHKLIEDLRHKIEIFRKREYISEAISQVTEDLNSFYHCYNIINANIGNCLVYRVRLCHQDTPHESPHEVWCPPSRCINTIGRANDIGKPVFYGALHPMTAISEAKVAEDHYFSLAIYMLKARSPYDNTSVVIKPAPPTPGLQNMFGPLGVELSAFMASEFTKHVPQGEEHHYKKSCAMAQLLLELPYKDSIIYPSVQDSDMINIALPEEHALERLSLKCVLHCVMRDTPFVLTSRVPDRHGNTLTVQRDESPHGFRLNCTGKPMSFASSFKNSNIATPEEILQYYRANKSLT